ncbi:MAG: fibronectin type III domain-containing protein [Pseudobdellovibrionaceae bacterium]
MMHLLLRILFTLTLLTGAAGFLPAAWAETYRREVSFEWEEIPGAKSYDIEIRAASKDSRDKPMSFRTKDATWSGKLVPGKYLMSLRSRDLRGVPGDWSPSSEFIVNLDPVKIKFPQAQALIKANDERDVLQKFEWDPVSGADEYRFDLSSEDGKTQITETLKEPRYSVKIPVAQNYTWNVTGLGHSVQSDSTTASNFSIIGRKITPPTIAPPETEFVREVRWSRPNTVEKYDLTLKRLNPQTKKWEKVLTQENVQGESFNFAPEYVGGTYNLQVQAKGHLREDSEVSKITFKVVNGNRSPAAEYTALVRKSIDRLTGWYGIASYFITQINYYGETPETGGLTTTTALGGTGRLGAGFFSSNNKWGFVGIVDMSGFIISGANHTYSSLELSGISRHIIGELGEARLIGGLYYKELPQLFGVPSLTGTNSQVTFFQSSVMGPHMGAEYWHSLSPKLGFQINTHLYYSLLTMKSPNGNNVEPRLSYQIGLLGSYRLNNRFTGLMGLTHRMDQVAYKANKTGALGEGPGDYDSSRITGQYLSFYAEYGF